MDCLSAFVLGAGCSASVCLLAMLIRADRREVRMTRTIYGWLRVWVETWGQDPVAVKKALLAEMDPTLHDD